MRYLSVCSGIEAATVAWSKLGFEAAAVSDIDPFPRALLRKLYPTVPLHDDFTTISGDEYGAIDILVGGTPCQSFSVAGKRLGLDDPRGNLALEFLNLARRVGAKWLVWENVPGVISSWSDDADGGERGDSDGEWRFLPQTNDFDTFLAFLQECGYSACWRIFDAQYFGVPQRRRRIFLVGYLGDWRPAAAVLLERESLQGHIEPRREERESSSAAAGANPEDGGPDEAHPYRMTAFGEYADDNSASTVKARDYKDATDVVAIKLGHTKSNGIGGSSDNQGYTLEATGSCNQAVLSFDSRQTPVSGNVTGPIDTRSTHAVVSFKAGQGSKAGGIGYKEEQAPTLRAADCGIDRSPSIVNNRAVRRLTPRECERLQGFPDDYTLIPFNGRPASDSARYKALGNSMAVPVMEWIGERIKRVEEVLNAQKNPT
jgi:DNA (cytosine-5)-methyltransferase 1